MLEGTKGKTLRLGSRLLTLLTLTALLPSRESETVTQQLGSLCPAGPESQEEHRKHRLSRRSPACSGCLQAPASGSPAQTEGAPPQPAILFIPRLQLRPRYTLSTTTSS